MSSWLQFLPLGSRALLPPALQMLVMQLRKCCNHPFLFPGAEPDFDGETTGA